MRHSQFLALLTALSLAACAATTLPRSDSVHMVRIGVGPELDPIDDRAVQIDDRAVQRTSNAQRGPSKTRHTKSALADGITIVPLGSDLHDVSRCAFACGDMVYAWTMPSYVSRDRPRTFGLIYNSRRAFPAPVFHVDAAVDGELTEPTHMRMSVTVGGAAQKHLGSSSVTVAYFEQSGFLTNRLAFQIDGRAFTDSLYSFTAQAAYRRYSDFFEDFIWSSVTPVSGRFMTLPRDTLKLAHGWAFAGVQKLKVVAGGVMITDGDGYAVYFANINGNFVPPGPERSRLTLSGSTYIRGYPDGTRITFDASTGRMVKVTDIYGNRDTLEWDGSGFLNAVRDPSGSAVTMTYSGGRLIKMSDTPTSGQRRTYTFSYNGSNELTAISDSTDGTSVQFHYRTDAGYLHLMDTVTNQVGKRTYIGYDHTLHMNVTELPQAKISDGTTQKPTSTFYWRDNPAVCGVRWGLGVDEETARDYLAPANADPTLITPRGHTYTFDLDRLGAMTAMYTPVGFRLAQFNRDTLSLVRFIRDFRGRTDSLYYDASGNLTKWVNKVTGRRDSTTYQTTTLDGFTVTVGALDVRNNAGAPQPSFRYTGVLLDSAWHHPFTDKTKFFWRADGRPDSIIDPAGHKTEYFYAASGMQNLDNIRTRVTRTFFYYDEFGRTFRIVGARGDSAKIRYDSRNRVTRTFNSAGDSTRYIYNALYLTQVIDPLDQTYTFAYNGIGQDTLHVDPGGRADSLFYDLNGNLGRWKNRRAQAITFTYDAVDRLTSRDANGQVSNYTLVFNDSLVVASNASSRDSLRFDLSGRLTTATTKRGPSFTTSYNIAYTNDLADRPTIVSGGLSSVSYFYATTGQLDSLWDAGGRTTKYSYNVERLGSSVIFPTQTTTTTATFAFPPSHTESSISYNRVSPDSVAGRRIEHDSLSRIIAAWPATSTTSDTFRIHRYDIAQRLWRTLINRTSTSSTCAPDDFGFHCTSTDTILLRFFEYLYDKAGNSNATSVQAGNRPQYVTTDFPGVIDTLTFDADGNLTERRSNAIRQTFHWDALSQLDSVLTYSSGTLHNVARMRYDAFGRRAWRHAHGDSIRYIWDGDVVFAEVDSTMTFSATYAYEPGSFSPHAVTRRSMQTYYYLYDEAQNVAGLMRQDGFMSHRYRYEPFGFAYQKTEEWYNAHRFGGQAEDHESALIYMRNRYYDFRTRRFISEDPIGLAGGINPYAYAGNDPINNSDPLGLQNKDCPGFRGPAESELGIPAIGIACPTRGTRAPSLRNPRPPTGTLPGVPGWTSYPVAGGYGDFAFAKTGLATRQAPADACRTEFIGGSLTANAGAGGVVGAGLWGTESRFGVYFTLGISVGSLDLSAGPVAGWGPMQGFRQWAESMCVGYRIGYCQSSAGVRSVGLSVSPASIPQAAGRAERTYTFVFPSAPRQCLQ